MNSTTLRVSMAFVLGAALLPAASISTTFASNNARRGNIFDVAVTNPLTVNSIEVNLAEGLTKEIFVYYKTGTWVGSQANPGAWTLAGSQTVTSSGNNVPTLVDIPDFALFAGTYGLFVTTDGLTVGAILYTNGTSSFSNADLTIFAGGGTLVPFDGNIVVDRIWNGTINYTLGVAEIPEPATFGLMSASLFAGALLRRGSRRLRAR